MKTPSTKGCTCSKCVAPCRTSPGWFTPQEAELAILAGHSERLMRDWLEPSEEHGNKERIYVLAPASVGCEGRDAPEILPNDPDDLEAMIGKVLELIGDGWEKGECTFLTEDNRCEIHKSGFKPKQCRECFGCKPDSGPDNFEMIRFWDNPEAQALVEKWRNRNETKKTAAA